jgi:hypothetical protein
MYRWECRESKGHGGDAAKVFVLLMVECRWCGGRLSLPACLPACLPAATAASFLLLVLLVVELALRGERGQGGRPDYWMK